MASSLLDELPCLLDEADELMARLAYFIKLTPARRGTGTTAAGAAVATESSSGKHTPSARTEQMAEGEQIRACLAASETESALKFFARQFLTAQPVPIDKMFALLQLSAPPSGTQGGAGTTLQAVAKKMYHLMKRVHHWQRAAWGTLTQFFAEASYLTFDKHRLLATLLLNTLTKYVKVHLLWTSCAVIPSLLAMHTFAQSASSSAARTGGATGVTDPSTTMYSLLEHVDHHLREYVLCFGSNPLVKIQHDFQMHPDGGEIARNLSALALSCFESFLGCHDLAQLRNQGVFDAETFAHGAYAARGVYDDLLYSRAQEDWVLCTALCLPQQLKAAPRSNAAAAVTASSVQLWDFVHVIAQDRLVLPVYRGVVVNIHSLLYQQIVAMLSATTTTAAAAVTTSSSSVLGLSPAASSHSPSPGTHVSLKKLMSALSKHALRTCAEQHQQRAQLVVWLLQSCIQLLTQTPALVAPLFPVLLAACEAARSEIEWRLYHDDQSAQFLLPTHVKSKYVQRARVAFASDTAARALGELLACTHTLRSLMHTRLDTVERYYEEFLAHGDADAIVYEIHELLSPGCSAATAVANTTDKPDPRTHQILSSFAVKERYSVVATNGRKASPWRREWRQLSIALLADRSASAQLPAALLKLMERACVHSKYVEFAGELLAHHAQLAKWWWFTPLIEKRFNQLLANRSGHGASAAMAMLGIVDATLTGRYELDEVVEDAEVREAIAAMQTLFERMETAVGAKLEQAIDAVVGCGVALHDHSSHSQASAGTTRSGSMDGTSSTQRAKTEWSLRQESRLAASSATLKSAESRFPSAIVSLRSGAGKPKRSDNRAVDSNMTRSGPLCDLIEADETLSALTAAIHARASSYHSACATTQRLAALVARHVRACLVRFLRGLVMLSDASSSTPSTAAATVRSRVRCGLEHASVELQCYITCVQQLFRNAAFVDLTSAVLETLASESRASTSVMEKWESVTVTELREFNCLERMIWFYLAMIDQALRTLLGTDGMRELSASVMRCASCHIQTLRLALEHDRIPLIWFGKCVDAPYTEAVLAVRQMQRLDDVTRALVRIGLLLFLCDLLRNAEPSIVSLQDDPQWQRALNAEYGIVRGDEFNGDIADEARAMSRRAVWQLLPVAFAASFHSELWRRSAYIEALDAADTNAHMSAVAVLHLLLLARESILVWLVSLLGSISAAPIPNGGLVMIYSIWSTIFPGEDVPITYSYLVAIYWYIDCMNTMCNVVGDTYVARIIAEQVDEAYETTLEQRQQYGSRARDDHDNEDEYDDTGYGRHHLQ